MIASASPGASAWGQPRELPTPRSTPRIRVGARDPGVIPMFHSPYYYGIDLLISQGSVKRSIKQARKTPRGEGFAFTKHRRIG